MEKYKVPLNEIQVFEYQIELPFAFKSNESLVKRKTSYIYSHSKSQGLVELPFSPSMGASVDDLVTDCELVRRNLTWMSPDFSLIEKPKKAARFQMQTMGIGNFGNYDSVGLLKLKGDRQTLGALVQQSHILGQAGVDWIVDFNRGLALSELNYFLNTADLRTCFGIEQPLPVGVIDSRLCKNAPIILDEEMAKISFKEIKEISPKAVVLKPWRYSYSEYLDWHHFLIENEIPYMVGSMIQGPVADNLCDVLNSFATIQYNISSKGFKLGDIFSGARSLGFLKTENI